MRSRQKRRRGRGTPLRRRWAWNRINLQQHPTQWRPLCPATITNGSRRQLKLTPGDNYQPGSMFRGRNRWFSRREPRREAEPTGG